MRHNRAVSISAAGFLRWLFAAVLLAGVVGVASGVAALRQQSSGVAITSGPSGTSASRDATFTFEAVGPDIYSSATCQLDGGPETACASPATYTGLADGPHTFVVRAYSVRGGIMGSDQRSWTVATPEQAPPPAAGPVQAGPPVVFVPDFKLLPVVGSTVAPVVMRPGQQAYALVTVLRTGGSKGGLSYSWSVLPAGIGKALSQDDPSDPKQLKVWLTAAPSAKPGSGKLTLTATPDPSAGLMPRSIDIPFVVVEQYDLAVTGIDVSQGIQLPQSQHSALPARNPYLPKLPVPYPGPPALKAFVPEGYDPSSPATSLYPLVGAAPLVQGKKTIVTAYAALVLPAAADLAKPTMLLRGRVKNGSMLPGSPLSVTRPTALKQGHPFHVPLEWVRYRTNGFKFELPESWTEHPEIVLEAELLPPAVWGTAECTVAICKDNNRFRLTGLKFTDTGYVNVWPLAFGGGVLEPKQVFEPTGRTLPLDEWQFRVGNAYRALYLGGTNQKTMLATVKAYVSDLPSACKVWVPVPRPTSCPDLVSAVTASKEVNGLSASGEDVFIPRPGMTAVTQWREFTSVGHETGHALGFAHADYACGGGSGDQEAEPWWPDEWGLLYGITLGGRVNGGGNVGTLGEPTGASPYDYMSYCAAKLPEDRSRLSMINYVRAFDGIRSLQSQRTGASAAAVARAAALRDSGAVLSVIGYVEGDSVVVTRARPKAGEPALGPADSPYRIVLRDAAGAPLADGPMRVERTEGHGSDIVFVAADVPLAGAAAGGLPAALRAVEVMSGGAVRARVARSAHPPTVEVVRPRGGERVAGTRPFVVRWSARDADGGAPAAAVDYSPDDGRTWRVLAGDVRRTRLALPGRMLTPARRARIRVRVSDGLDEAAAVSQRFVARGAAPTVRITTPERQTLMLGTADPLLLEASADDDMFRPLTGRSLTWFDGRRRIASGQSAVVTSLRPGVHRIRVVARDRIGRTAGDAVVVRVRAVAPRLILSGVPSRLAAGARSVRLGVAATLPGRLTVGGSSLRGRGPRVPVGGRARRVSIPVRAGKGPVRLVLRVSASGKASNVRVTVARTG